MDGKGMLQAKIPDFEYCAISETQITNAFQHRFSTDAPLRYISRVSEVERVEIEREILIEVVNSHRILI
jgi:hypothetical protein